MQLRLIEDAKIECAGRSFAALNAKRNQNVMYHAVDSYTKLMQLVAG
jgi:restriction endonuclease